MVSSTSRAVVVAPWTLSRSRRIRGLTVIATHGSRGPAPGSRVTRETDGNIVTRYDRLMATHAVTNQAPPLVGYDVFGADRVLVDALERWGDHYDATALHDLGRVAGPAPAQGWADEAERNPPRLHTHRPTGE